MSDGLVVCEVVEAERGVRFSSFMSRLFSGRQNRGKH